ncbi:MAG: GDP-mannose 4,6-dehydratase [Candidatus Schekmanbacteria bacterium]|nr:GDP-mannose 4,6-dehydratase [Candidatus Schekmanbacteria bacterium]
MKGKVVITGGAGFIGSQVCRKLLPQDVEILIYDNFFTGRESNLPDNADGRLSVKKGDLNDPQMLRAALQEFSPDVVFHLAALHYIPYCDENSRETLRVNVEGTESVLEACAQVKPRKVLIASSAAVYRINDAANLETDVPAPYDIYGYAKYFSERLAYKFQQSTGITTIAARIFNTYGPYETTPHVIPRVIDQLKDGNATLTLGDISPKRDFVYVEDMAEALIALMEKSQRPFDTFNIGTGVEYSVAELIEICSKALQRKIIVKSADNLFRKIDRPHLLADVSKIKKGIGWQARFSFLEGMEKTLKFYL